MNSNEVSEVNPEINQEAETNQTQTNPAKRGRRRDPLNELIDDLNKVIANPDARPETVEKSIKTKADVMFRQLDSKMAELTRENAALKEQNAALLTELDGSPDADPPVVGCRSRAIAYDQLKPEHDKLVSDSNRAKRDAEKAANENEALIADLRSFVTFARSSFDAVKQRLLARRFFLAGVPSQISGKSETLQALGVSEQDVERWQAFRRHWFIDPPIPLDSTQGKAKLVEVYEKETTAQEPNKDFIWFLWTWLARVGINADEAVIKLQQYRREQASLQVTQSTLGIEIGEEKPPADIAAAARDAEVDAAYETQRGPRVDVPDYQDEWR